MRQKLEHALVDAFLQLEKETGEKRPGSQLLFSHQSTETLVKEGMAVLHGLVRRPFRSARNLAGELGLSRNRLLFLYKLIQRSDALQHHLRSSENRDYFNVVRHYFDNRLYTVVFFVGRTCPSRCVFCPNVHIDAKTGRRRLVTYGKGEKKAMSREEIQGIFRDLGEKKEGGSNLLVKISGGLEPLTDIRTMGWITDFAKEIGVATKLFTNGILLNSPARRRAALKTSDIRISLSTADDATYDAVCFGRSPGKRSLNKLKMLRKNIRDLIAERDAVAGNVRIGFNTIIMPENGEEIPELMDLARDLGVDYIDFKPDYFSARTQGDTAKIHAAVAGAKEHYIRFNGAPLYINFVDSLSSENFFWEPRDGAFDALQQTDYKIFITPFGDCSPIHYGAFPHAEMPESASDMPFSIGKIQNSGGLTGVLEKPVSNPMVSWDKLNPFEMMLSLEILREKSDADWQIPLACSPYHISRIHEIPTALYDGGRGSA